MMRGGLRGFARRAVVQRSAVGRSRRLLATRILYRGMASLTSASGNAVIPGDRYLVLRIPLNLAMYIMLWSGADRCAHLPNGRVCPVW